MSNLSGTTITWRGLTLSGSDDAPYGITSFQGWEGLPAGRREAPARPASHGRFDGPTWADERIVTVGGVCYSETERDALLLALSGAMTWPTDGGLAEDLTVHHLGRELSAGARLTAFEPVFDSTWSVGHFSFALEWRCPDPLRYGARISDETSFPELVGGLRYDLYTDGAGTTLGYLDYGVASTTGRLSLSNTGTADSWPQFEVSGPVDASGFEIVRIGTDERLVFAGAVPSGSRLVLDSATGSVLMDGTQDRQSYLTYRDWAPVPAGGSVEFAFLPRGASTSASLVASLRPAFW